MIALSGSLGVSGYVAQSSSEGAITYVEYSYALETGFPAVALENSAGYFTEPTADNVAVSLLKAQINNDPSSPAYLTQNLSNVYRDPDPRTYEMSSYSYLIIPTAVQDGFSTDKGYTLGRFIDYALCQGQQEAPILGYSPLPINLAEAGFAQVRKIPGVDAQSINIRSCDNPTFSPSGQNTLALEAPYPPACAHVGPTQCTSGTAGAGKKPTPPTRGTPPSQPGAPGGSTPGGTSPAGGKHSTKPSHTGGGHQSTTGTTSPDTTGTGPGTPGGTLPLAEDQPVYLGVGLGASDLPYVFGTVVLLFAIVVVPLVRSRVLRRRGRR
jgi:hypothetical protein